MSRAPCIVVTAAVVERDGRFLVTRRRRARIWPAMWEFPGGKCEPARHSRRASARNAEELGADVEVGELVFTVGARLSRAHVELHFYGCQPRRAAAGAGTGDALGAARRAASLEFPPADEELIAMLIAAT